MSTDAQLKERFPSLKQRNCYKKLCRCNFTTERFVALLPGDYPEFQGILEQRGWNYLASPEQTFDPDIVREFYANAYPEGKKGPEDRVSMVQGIEVPFDRSIISELIGNPPSAERDDYLRLKTHGGLTLEQTATTLCRPNMSFAAKPGEPLKLYRGAMSKLTQVVVTFIINNIAPNSHKSDITVEMSHFIYCIMTPHLHMDVAQKISDEIYQCAIREGTKPLLGFPALITLLCEYYGVQVSRTQKIGNPITRRYIELNCREHEEATP